MVGKQEEVLRVNFLHAPEDTEKIRSGEEE
jgi:hypothetical protein